VAATLGVAVGAILLALAQFVHGHPQLAAPDFRVAFVTMGLIHALTVLRFWSLPPGAGAEMIGRPAPRPGG
jgi:hypothetical protein